MYYAYLFAHASFLKIIDHFSENKEYLYDQLARIASNQELRIVMYTKSFRLVGFNAVLAIETEDHLHHLLVNRIFLDYFGARIGISDEQVSRNSGQIVEV